MEDLNKYTPIELLKIANDIKAKHDALKTEIINNSFIIDELKIKLDKKLKELDNLEKDYVNVIEEMNNR